MTPSPSIPTTGLAVVIGSSGTIDSALLKRLRAAERFDEAIGFARGTDSALDLTNEASIEAAAATAKARGLEVRLVLDATGFLHGGDSGGGDPDGRGLQPEKTWRHLTPEGLAYAFAVNATGPVLVMKHFLPLLPRKGRVVFASLSARAGSIAKNDIGGWYGYRASKAALNQLVRTAANELGRKNRDAVCVTLHPGHVESELSAPFGSGGNPTLGADDAAERLMAVLDGLSAGDTGGFFDTEGAPIPW